MIDVESEAGDGEELVQAIDSDSGDGRLVLC